MNPYQLITGLLQFRRDYIVHFGHVHRKGYEGWRNVDLIKGSGHAVLSANGGQPEALLCGKCPQQRGKRLTPAFRVSCHPAEVFLEGKAYLFIVAAVGNDSGNRLCHRIDSAVIWAPAGDIGVKSIAHHGYGVRRSVSHRHLSHHGLGLCQLVFTAVRHQHAGRPDGGIEHLHQTLL